MFCKRIGSVFKILPCAIIATADIGKFWFYGYCRASNGAESAVRRFSNTGYGYRKFESFVMDFCKKQHGQDVVMGFESTGCFGIPFMHFWCRRHVHLVQVNPMHTKKMKEVQDNSPNKTDKKDPRVIADIIELGRSLSVVIPEGIAAELRQYIHGRERTMQHLHVLQNQLQDLAFVLSPEFFAVVPDLTTKSAHYLLRHYPRPEQIAFCNEEDLYGVLHRVSKGQFKRERVMLLREAALQSAGIKEGVEGIVYEMGILLDQIEQVEAIIEQLETRIGQYLPKIPWSRILLSIKGIGPITAAGLIGELVDLSSFGSINAVMKYAGLNLYEVSSGKHQGQRRISKRGRPLLRKLLYYAVLNLIRCNVSFAERYQEYVKRGMKKSKALIALSRKLLRMIYSMVRNQTEYDEQYAYKEAA